MTMSKGFVHSIEIGSFVDGPGARLVVFLSGCPLRCQYCHNPETWKCRGEPTDVEEIAEKMARSTNFLKAGSGGVTVSGGEPLAQAAFTLDILKAAKSLGLHTALDTSGYLEHALTNEMLEQLDLVLLDIKSWDPDVYREVTGVDVTPTLMLAERLSQVCKPMWVRFVVVPGLTDGKENVEGLARFVGTLTNVERMELVPFHQMGRHKWQELGMEYRLTDTPEATPAQMAEVRRIFEAQGVRVNETRLAPCGSAEIKG